MEGIAVDGLIALCILIGLYMLPTIVAASREHRNMGPIIVINVLLGWTFVGWVVALAMAASNDVKQG